MQQLVAREEELNSELQNMESETNQDEPAFLTQREEVTTTTFSESEVEGAAQEVIDENAQNENELAPKESNNQVPVCPMAPDISLAKTTKKVLPSPSSTSDMKFYVRALEGHNDVICSVHCEGSVLVSGRCVSFCNFTGDFKNT